jgi:hypothetical protein
MLLEGCSADLSSNRRLVRRSLSVNSWSSWRSVYEQSEFDGNNSSSALGVYASSGSNSPCKVELTLVRLIRLGVVGVLMGLDMVDMVGMNEWMSGRISCC